MIHSRDGCSWQWGLYCLLLLNVSSAFMINHAPYRFKGSTVETANKRILHHSRMIENNDKVTCTALWNSKNPNEIKKDSELEDAPNGNENDFLKRIYAPRIDDIGLLFSDVVTPQIFAYWPRRWICLLSSVGRFTGVNRRTLIFAYVWRCLN